MSLSLPEPVLGREAQFMTDLFDVLGAGARAVVAEEQRIKAERRNRPEARARRSEGARKGWETRRARQAAEDAEERARYDRPTHEGPVCDGIYHDSRGHEMTCMRPPDHDGNCDDR